MKAVAASLLAVALATTGSPLAWSAAPAKETIVADPFEQVVAARQVADFARRRSSAQAMLVAARMVQEVRFDDRSSSTDGPSTAAAGPPPFSADALFDEADALAKNDESLKAQIRIARNSGRGVISSAFGKGLVRVVKEVGARAAFAFDVQAKPGELLRIGAIGDTTTKMALRMRDKRGAMLCDDAGDYAPVCSFKPSVATALHVEVLNQGDAPTKAVILSN